jgi:hypothetical protein
MEHAPIELLSAFVEKFTANENLSFTAKSPPGISTPLIALMIRPNLII